MKGRIHKLHDMAPGKVFKVPYVRVEFLMEDGKWARTDICPTFRNFTFWKKHLTIGVILKCLEWKIEKERMLNADAAPLPCSASDFHPPEKPAAPIPDPQMSLL